MPTYEYQCPKGHQFEKLQKITDRSRPRCPECGAVAERKISGGAGLLFKGSGFYITDYGKDGKGPRKDGAEKPETSRPDAPAEKKPEKQVKAEKKPAPKATE
jgi:putative FmdB family regulatory protein